MIIQEEVLMIYLSITYFHGQLRISKSQSMQISFLMLIILEISQSQLERFAKINGRI